MCYYPRSSSSYSRTSTSFYLTSLHPPSYYSSKINLYTPKNNRAYIINSSPNTSNRDTNNNLKKSIDIFRSNINKLRSSPFYNNEKSLRLQDEIDWINKIVSRKSKINKIIETNTFNNFIKGEENEIRDIIRSQKRFEQLNNINNDINRLNYQKFNYIDSYLSHREDPYPLIITTIYKRNGLFNKNDVDIFNHKVFMNEMINFRNDGINKWKKDFQSKFNEY